MQCYDFPVSSVHLNELNQTHYTSMERFLQHLLVVRILLLLFLQGILSVPELAYQVCIQFECTGSLP